MHVSTPQQKATGARSHAGTHREPDHRKFLLACMRQLALDLNLVQVELSYIIVAVQGFLITPEDACAWLHDLDLLWCLPMDVVTSEEGA